MTCIIIKTISQTWLVDYEHTFNVISWNHLHFSFIWPCFESIIIDDKEYILRDDVNLPKGNIWLLPDTIQFECCSLLWKIMLEEHEFTLLGCLFHASSILADKANLVAKLSLCWYTGTFSCLWRNYLETIFPLLIEASNFTITKLWSPFSTR